LLAGHDEQLGPAAFGIGSCAFAQFSRRQRQ
jgi:hypothetical protein